MNATIPKPFRSCYIAGETAVLAVHAPDASAISVIFGNAQLKLAKDGEGGMWRGRISTDNLLGSVRFTVFADDADGTTALASGTFTVRCAGRSKMRDVVDKIDEAISTWGTNPNRSLSVEGINITYKTLDELLAVRAQYVARAEAEEGGRPLTVGPQVMEVHF